MTVEVEAVTHALHWIVSRGDSQTTHMTFHHPHRFNEHAIKMKSGMGSPDWTVFMVDIHLQKLLWVNCLGHARVKGNDRADRLVGKATLTNGLLLGRSEVLRSLRHYLWARTSHH